MAKFTEINIEEGMPSCADALTALKNAITLCKTNKVQITLIIHGYGSSGKGGTIRIKARQWLNAQVKNGKLKAVINGEDFDIFNFKALELKNKCSELEQLLACTNHGVTVIEL